MFTEKVVVDVKILKLYLESMVLNVDRFSHRSILPAVFLYVFNL
jgi:hypothetical protein